MSAEGAARWLSAHKRSLLLAFALVVVAGVVDAARVPVGLFPIIDFPRIVVSVDAGERPIDRMVTDVTRPVEEALRAVPHVRTVRSTSSRGAADVSLSFDWGVDMTEAALQTQAVLAQLGASLPPGTTFDVRRMDPTVFPVLGFSLTSATRDPVSLRDFAVLRLRPILSSIPGVASVDVLGGAVAEVQVVVDPMKLAAHGLGTDDVVDALGQSSGVSAIGRVEDHDRLYLVVDDAGYVDVDDVKKTPVASAAGAVVTVGDVADVTLARATQWTRVTAGGTDAVLVDIRQQRDGNTLAIKDAVFAALRAHESELPRDVVIKPWYDQGELVRASSTSVRDAILLGALFAAAVLFAFLRNLRVTLVVAVVLPGVLAATVLVLERVGMTLNVMTLGGMAAAVGLVIDDAVVVIENIARRMAAERPPAGGQAPAPDAAGAPARHPEAADVIRGGLEMARPLTGSSLATIVVFVPLAFLGGVAGAFFKALALTIAVSLALSYAFSLVAVPLLAHAVLDPRHRPPAAGRALAAAQRAYERLTRALLARRLLVVPIVAALAASGGLAYRALGQGFMPVIDEGGFILDYTAPPGTSLSETDRMLRIVEQRIQALPEVDNYSRRTGLQLGGALTEVNTGDYFIHLRPLPRRDIEEVMSDLRRQVERDVPGLRIETAQLMEDLIGDLTAVPQPVEVKIFGGDEAALEEAGRRVAAALEKVPGLVEVFDGVTVAGDDIVVRVDRARAQLEHLRPEAVDGQAGLLLEGRVAADFRRGQQTLGVRVWGPPASRARVESVPGLRLEGGDGQMLPLARVARVGVSEGRAEVTRENLEQMVAVTARLEGRDLASAMRDVKEAVAKTPLPPGLRVAYGGLYAEQARSLRDLALVFASAVVLVALLLMFLYERAAIVAAILATTFLSAAGVLVGLWLTKTELNLSSMMGLTMIVGIVTELCIFFFAELGDDVDPDHEALVRAGKMRLRPILMTSIIAVLALFPLALGIGQGARMQAPLAVAIISGLVTAVPLVLVVMPVLQSVFARRRSP